MRATMLFLLLALATVANAAEVKVAPALTVKAGVPEKLSATSDDKAPIKWLNAHGDLLKVLDFEAGRSVFVWSETPGVYRVAVISEKGGKESWVVITVEARTPPIPPVPPKPPEPPAPDPSDPLVASLQAAYASDPDNIINVGKSVLKSKLAAAWRAGAAAASNGKAVTYGELLASVVSACEATVGPVATVLPSTRKAVAAHLRTVMPTDGKRPLSAASSRDSCSIALNRVAAALEAVK